MKMSCESSGRRSFIRTGIKKAFYRFQKILMTSIKSIDCEKENPLNKAQKRKTHASLLISYQMH